MAVLLRPRRSLLYMPGSNPRALDKAKTLPADGLIFDLEDAVAPDRKDQARANVAAALATGGYGEREIILRINPLDSPWGHADLALCGETPLDAVLLPKVESPDQLRDAAALLRKSGAPDGLSLWCMIETPLGVLYAREIAAASPRLGALVVGASDLAKDLNARVTPDRLPLLTALGVAVLAARAYGLAVLDGVELDLADEQGFILRCRQGRELGFDGKTLIHPKQIAAANEVFAPSAEEIAAARRVIAAYAAAAARGEGVVLVDGALVEALHVENARRLLALAEAIARLAATR